MKSVNSLNFYKSLPSNYFYFKNQQFSFDDFKSSFENSINFNLQFIPTLQYQLLRPI